MQSTRTDAGDDEEDELGVEHGEDGGGEGADDVFERPAVVEVKWSKWSKWSKWKQKLVKIGQNK